MAQFVGLRDLYLLIRMTATTGQPAWCAGGEGGGVGETDSFGVVLLSLLLGWIYTKLIQTDRLRDRLMVQVNEWMTACERAFLGAAIRPPGPGPGPCPGASPGACARACVLSDRGQRARHSKNWESGMQVCCIAYITRTSLFLLW